MLADFIDRDDVGMVQRRGSSRFLFESTKTLGVRSHLLGQDFDSDLATELEIPGLVDLTHTTGAQLGEHFVVAEAGAGLEGHQLSLGTSRSSSSNQF